MKQIVVYTVVCGHYDKLNSVFIDDNFDYICFTDYNFNGVIPNPWRHVRLPLTTLNNKDLSRYCKLLPHYLLPQYESSIYIDGNIEIKQSISELAAGVFNISKVAAYEHWERASLEHEFIECAKCGFDFIYKLKRQYSQYVSQGFQSHELFENNILFRKHLNPQVIKMNELWWKEYTEKGKRDQYSFVYVAYKSDIKIYSLGEHDARVMKRYFEYHSHISARPFSMTLLKMINRIYMFFRPWDSL